MPIGGAPINVFLEVGAGFCNQASNIKIDRKGHISIPYEGTGTYRGPETT